MSKTLKEQIEHWTYVNDFGHRNPHEVLALLLPVIEAAEDVIKINNNAARQDLAVKLAALRKEVGG